MTLPARRPAWTFERIPVRTPIRDLPADLLAHSCPVPTIGIGGLLPQDIGEPDRDNGYLKRGGRPRMHLCQQACAVTVPVKTRVITALRLPPLRGALNHACTAKSYSDCTAAGFMYFPRSDYRVSKNSRWRLTCRK